IVRAPAGFAGALGVGAGTAPTIARAWWKALAEAFAARSAGAKLALLAAAPPPEEIASFEDHINFYAAPNDACDFLDAGAGSTRAADVPRLEGATSAEYVEALCGRVAAAGSSAYAVDVTPADVRGLGLTVTKVVAPELCALDVVQRA